MPRFSRVCTSPCALCLKEISHIVVPHRLSLFKSMWAVDDMGRSHFSICLGLQQLAIAKQTCHVRAGPQSKSDQLVMGRFVSQSRSISGYFAIGFGMIFCKILAWIWKCYPESLKPRHIPPAYSWAIGFIFDRWQETQFSSLQLEIKGRALLSWY